ncbi:MAG TPA: LLM class F420-dependent oxidoreductase [Acidimicrobiales bacterium]|nr:LLM class F420-dependent oxidoreductase [Acidimicrobiales bacterium]
MKFGLPLFGVSPRHYAEVARVAEENGIESVWMPEHLVMPTAMPPTYLYSEDGMPPIVPETPLYDPWVMLGGVATATTTLRLGTLIYIVPLRHPLAVARSVVSLDRLSGGRAILGAGVGWLEEEFDAVGLSFRDRGARTDEAIAVMRRLWTEGVIDHRHGTHFHFGPVRFEPKPVQKSGIPIEVGGTSPAALRRAGHLGDGWLETGEKDLDGVAAKLAVIDRHRREAGRDHLPFEVTTGLGHDADSISRCRDIGVTRIMTGPGARAGRLTIEEVSDWAKRFADEVVSRFGA